MHADQADPTVLKVSLPYYKNSCIYFERIRGLPYPILLDSNSGNSLDHNIGQFDLVTAAPIATIQSADTIDALEVPSYLSSAQADTNIEQSQLSNHIKELIQRYTTNNSNSANSISSRDHDDNTSLFISGLFSVCSYDFGKQRHIRATKNGYNWPDFYLGVYQWAINIDHNQEQATLLADPKLDAQEWKKIQALFCADNFRAKTDGDGKPSHSTTNVFKCLQPWQSNTTLAQYKEKFSAATNYIMQGDCYQINLSQRFETRFTGDPWQAYQVLKRKSPTPYAAFIELPDAVLCSFSPERFIKVENKTITTQPIKGTRPRGKNSDEDKQLIKELSQSCKERSENLMIVDLMRNDIAQCAKTGSVKVNSLFDVETHPNVHHLVSTIEGVLADDKNCFDLLLQALPGGSITGAPKKRAIEIIDELENDARGIYCGSIAYIDSRGKMDSNILIRSILFEQNKEDKSKSGIAYCWGGGGIVADSIAGNEYQETLFKVENLMQTLSEM